MFQRKIAEELKTQGEEEEEEEEEKEKEEIVDRGVEVAAGEEEEEAVKNSEDL